MIKLRVVGSSEDHSELILSNKSRGKRGSHKVVIDRKLLDVLQDAVYGRREMERQAVRAQRALEPRAEPKIPPREIQRQLRAGSSPAQVARAAGVDEAYVDQFYPPILYERAGVIQDAQELYQEKPRLGASKLPLGEAVEVNLSARRVNMTDEQLAEAWTATRSDGQPWTLVLTFPFRGRSRSARWRYDPRVRELMPVNKLAIDIGWVSPSSRVTPTQRAGAAKPPASGTAGPKKKPVAKKKAARKKPAPRRKPTARKKPTSRRKPVARKRAAKKMTAPRRKPAARKKATRKKTAPRRKPVARKKATRKKTAPRRKPAARKPARKATPSRRKPARRR